MEQTEVKTAPETEEQMQVEEHYSALAERAISVVRNRPSGDIQAKARATLSAAAWVSSARAPWPHSTLPVMTVMTPS